MLATPPLRYPAATDLDLPTPTVQPAMEPGEAQCALIFGDNLAALRAMSSAAPSCVTLAYLDPPFLTGKQHLRVTRKRDPGTGEYSREKSVAFDDRWGGLQEYLASLKPRLEQVRTLLTNNGSVVVHVDSKTSHYVKVMCDEIFGYENFASEIIWRYRRWPSKTPNFQRVHDVLLRYVKDAGTKPRFNQLYEPLAASTQATWGDRKQRAVIGKGGRRTRSSKTSEATPGTPMGDVWEISIIAPVAKERTGYPTQKPRALLQRLITSLSNPGDLVLDPYMGSGTTVEVARRQNRRVIGIDVGTDALDVTQTRLSGAKIHYTRHQVQEAPASHKCKMEFQTRKAEPTSRVVNRRDAS